MHYSPSYSPRKDFEQLLKIYNVKVTLHEVKAKDGTILRYRRLGNGKNVYFLANGVGTDFFMWLSAFRSLLTLCPTLFDKITLIAPKYRGLFEPNDDSFLSREVSITVAECVDDLMVIMKHGKVSHMEGLIGWSTGAQVGLELAAKYPDAVSRLFLFNPSCGQTLHTALQPFFPLPPVIGRAMSNGMSESIIYLKTLIYLPFWNQLKSFNDSIYFYLALSVFAFFGGFPPEQPAFFHEYMKDAFQTRSQTRALLDLILSLDEPMSSDCLKLRHPTTILSGTPDFLTGVYHSHRLSASLPNSRHVNFTMGSHFLLIEWPNDVAKELQLFFEKV
jgi:pimeloyl-ACP methyl ester carboxylesterase